MSKLIEALLNQKSSTTDEDNYSGTIAKLLRGEQKQETAEQPAFEKTSTTDHAPGLTGEEIFAAEELNLSPSEFRQWRASGALPDDDKKLVNSPRWQDQKKYEKEWKKELENQSGQAMAEGMAEEITKSKEYWAKRDLLETEKEERLTKIKKAEQKEEDENDVFLQPEKGAGFEAGELQDHSKGYSSYWHGKENEPKPR